MTDPAPPSTPHPPAAPITREDVLAVARLARLDLPPERADLFRHQLASIVAYVDRLQGLNLQHSAPLTSPLESDPPAHLSPSQLAPDLPAPTLAPDVALGLAPERADGYYRVPQVLGQGESGRVGGAETRREGSA